MRYLNGGRLWTEDEKTFALSRMAVMTTKEIADALGRTESSVRAWIACQGLSKPYVRHSKQVSR